MLPRLASNSWVQPILLLQPLKSLGLDYRSKTTVSGSKSIKKKDHTDGYIFYRLPIFQSYILKFL
jgi:hypothetical protein